MFISCLIDLYHSPIVTLLFSDSTGSFPRIRFLLFSCLVLKLRGSASHSFFLPQKCPLTFLSGWFWLGGLFGHLVRYRQAW